MNIFSKFFYLCSGSSLTLLKRYPTEGPKYAGIGATIFFTGLFAALAGGYATYTIFDDPYVAAGVGIAWGLMIFNLDRFIVSSMRKTGNKNKEWLMALPRIILALIIAIVISKPLELKIFEKEINNELVLMKQEIRNNQESAIRSRFSPEIIQSSAIIDTLKNEINRAQERVQFLEGEAVKEADGTGGTGIRNKGPIYALKKAEADKARTLWDSLKTVNEQQIAKQNVLLDSIQQLILVEKAESNQNEYNGLASRLEGMDRIANKSAAIQWAEWFIILLFIAIECAPIFVKLMSSKGPYDDRLQVHEFQSHAYRTEFIAHHSGKTRENAENIPSEEKEWLNVELLKTVKTKE